MRDLQKIVYCPLDMLCDLMAMRRTEHPRSQNQRSRCLLLMPQCR
jgi:hypothetical protein